jgi:hypothetical protein
LTVWDIMKYYEKSWSHLPNPRETREATCMYHWGVFVPSLLQWKCNNYNTIWVCICSPRYATCNVHLLYCHLWSAPLYNIFPHYLINGTILKEVIEHEMCVLIFSTTFFQKVFHSKNWMGYWKCILVFT